MQNTSAPLPCLGTPASLPFTLLQCCHTSAPGPVKLRERQLICSERVLLAGAGELLQLEPSLMWLLLNGSHVGSSGCGSSMGQVKADCKTIEWALDVLGGQARTIWDGCSSHQDTRTRHAARTENAKGKQVECARVMERIKRHTEEVLVNPQPQQHIPHRSVCSWFAVHHDQREGAACACVIVRHKKAGKQESTLYLEDPPPPPPVSTPSITSPIARTPTHASSVLLTATSSSPATFPPNTPPRRAHSPTSHATFNVVTCSFMAWMPQGMCELGMQERYACSKHATKMAWDPMGQRAAGKCGITADTCSAIRSSHAQLAHKELQTQQAHRYLFSPFEGQLSGGGVSETSQDRESCHRCQWECTAQEHSCQVEIGLGRRLYFEKVSGVRVGVVKCCICCGEGISRLVQVGELCSESTGYHDQIMSGGG
ncbi:hypothetical protein B0H10DRAFT_1945962 [Mycena sp. CBHHK59/15]|nr:hypothetical protein B0H10DRAFT_1945962 [Mycena sp. CBHHK59/15]